MGDVIKCVKKLEIIFDITKKNICYLLKCELFFK